jgi:hypothetical protein
MILSVCDATACLSNFIFIINSIMTKQHARVMKISSSLALYMTSRCRTFPELNWIIHISFQYVKPDSYSFYTSIIYIAIIITDSPRC